jgi:hypothetical protein
MRIKPYLFQILSSDVSLPIDAISLGVRVTLQTSLLPHIILEDNPIRQSNENQASLMNIKARVPFDERAFRVDDDWVCLFKFRIDINLF